MSNYIIAGEAGSPDLADCEYLGKKLQASTPSTQVHIISKHISEWDDFLKKICSSYGFKEPSSPIVFTVEGQLIGDKHAFKEHILQFFSVKGELDKNMRSLISEYDKVSLETHRQKLAEGPSVKEQVKEKITSIKINLGMQIVDGFFEKEYDNGFEFWVKRSQMLSPYTYDKFESWGENLDFTIIPEFMPPKVEEDMASHQELKISDEFIGEHEEGLKNDEDLGSEIPEKEKSPTQQGSPLMTNNDEGDSMLIYYEVDDRNIRKFIEYFTNAKSPPEILNEIKEVEIPNYIKTIPIYDGNIIRDLPKQYMLALSPFPLIPEEMIVFSGKKIEGGLLLRDFSMMQNWLKVITIPPQRPVYRDGDIVEPVIPKEPLFIKDISGNCINQRGYTYKTLEFSYECSRDSSLKLNTINILIRHILTECDWEVWHKAIKELDAIGYYQLLPYGEMNYQPLRTGQMLLSMLPISGVSLSSFYDFINSHTEEREPFTNPDYHFDHIIFILPHKNLTSRVISEYYLSAIEKMDIAHKTIDCGVNIILGSGFLMVVPIYRPYATVYGRNLYPDPLWYCGVISLPVIPKQWPETAGEVIKSSPFELLELCSNFVAE